MAIVTGRSNELVERGPRIRVRLSSPFFGDPVETEPNGTHGEWVEALPDTGAAITVVANDLANRVGLFGEGIASVATPSNAEIECQQYVARIGLADDRAIDLRVVSMPMHDLGVELLLGRDVLARCLLVYQGHDDSFTLAL
jgi:hypothetical protein